MPDYRPTRFIDEAIEAGFDRPPALEKKPGCPQRFAWRGTLYEIVELIAERNDYTRRGRMARNMQPQHAATASGRGSWGVGRYYFQVRVSTGQAFEIYYDRAPKGSAQRKGAWFVYSELVPT